MMVFAYEVGAGSSEEEEEFVGSGSEDGGSETDLSEISAGISGGSQLQPSAAPVVNLTLPSANTQSSGVFQPFAVAADDDDSVQVLTSAEAAAEAAAAARRASENPNASSRKRKRPLVETKAEATECTICCEDCTLVGRHRLVALKCGHLFGKKCIERWITERRACPNCSAIVRRTDICLLFSDHVAVVDNSGIEDLTSKFEVEKKKNSKMEKEAAALKQQLEVSKKEAAELKSEVAKYKRYLANFRCTVDKFDGAAGCCG